MSTPTYTARAGSSATAYPGLTLTLNTPTGYDTISGLPTGHGILTTDTVNVWQSGSQLRTAVAVHSVAANSITLVHSTAVAAGTIQLTMNTWHWDSAITWTATNGATAGHSPGGTSKSSPLVPGDAAGLAVIPVGAAVCLDTHDDIRTFGVLTGVVNDIGGTLNFGADGLIYTLVVGANQTWQVEAGGKINGPSSSGAEWDWSNLGTAGGTVVLLPGAAVSVTGYGGLYFDDNLLVINPHLIAVASSSQSSVDGPGESMRQQITDPSFSITDLYGSYPCAYEMPQGQISPILGQTLGACFMPVGNEGGTNLTDSPLVPLIALYRTPVATGIPALVMDVTVTLNAIERRPGAMAVQRSRRLGRRRPAGRIRRGHR